MNNKSEKMNKHEGMESKGYERKEKKTRSEPEYKKSSGQKKNYKGKMC